MAQKLHIHTLLRSHGLRRLLPYVRRNSTRLGLGMLCALAATTFTYLTVRIFGMFTDAATGVHFDPGLIQRLGDQIRHGQRDPATIQQLLDVVAKAIPDQHAINRDAYLLSLVFFLKGICWYGQSYFVSSASQKALLRLRNDVYSHLQRMGLSFFDRRKTGQLMATVTADIPQIQTAVGQNIIDAVNSPFTIIAGITYVVWLNWRLALLSAAIIPFMSLLIGAARRRMGRATKQMQIALADISELMEETLACVRVVRACVTEEAETQRFIANSQNSYRAYMRGVRIMSSLRPMVELIGSLGITLAIWVGEKQIASDPQHFTLGDLLQFVGAVHYISQAFGGLGNLSLGFQQANVAAERVFALLDEAPDVQDAPDAPDLGPVQGSLQFLDVEFAYDESPVLKGISFSVSPGEALAIVGLSGAGKSTIANLIPRFYDVTGGSIRIDQTDIRSVTTASLRRQIGIVPQETILFGVSIRDNIAYGTPGATDADVQDAARAANAYEFIQEMPKGFATVVGPRGATLSGGQRQRVAIARAILRNPRILILDEATSSLDAQSEAVVQEALERLMPGRTTIIIAHRLSTVRNADRILVLSNGQIVEEGKHSALMSQKGLYASLYEKQMHRRDDPIEEANAEPPPSSITHTS